METSVGNPGPFFHLKVLYKTLSKEINSDFYSFLYLAIEMLRHQVNPLHNSPSRVRIDCKQRFLIIYSTSQYNFPFV